jgi:hypothetical protein
MEPMKLKIFILQLALAKEFPSLAWELWTTDFDRGVLIRFVFNNIGMSIGRKNYSIDEIVDVIRRNLDAASRNFAAEDI